MNKKTARKLRQTIRKEYKREMRQYYNLPFWTRLKMANAILFKIYPDEKR